MEVFGGVAFFYSLLKKSFTKVEETTLSTNCGYDEIIVLPEGE